MTTVSRHQSQILRDCLEQQQSKMVELLSELAKAESPSHVPDSQQQVQRILRSALGDLGYHVSHFPGQRTGGQLLAVPGGLNSEKPIQLLLGHCDTVWPLGTLEKMPVEQRENRLHGPGVYDMKAGLVQAIFAIGVLREAGFEPPLPPVLFINSDEEIGSPESSEHILELAKKSDRAFVMEPSLGASGKLKTTRKGVGRFVVRVIGRASHAGLAPEEGASAILELSHVIQQLFALNDPSRGITVNVGMIDGGLRANVIAPESSAQVDVRVATRADAEQIEKAIHSLQPMTPGTQLQISGRIGRPPMEKTVGNQRLWELAQAAADELGITIEEGAAGGGSDGNSTSQLVPTLDGMGAVGDGAHAVSEFVYVDRLAERAALLARMLLFSPLSDG